MRLIARLPSVTATDYLRQQDTAMGITTFDG